jgi:ABC-type sugar transport system ATPase subunit
MTVQHIENLGPHQLVYLRTGHGEPITVQYQGDDRLEIGHEVTLAFAPDRALLFA